MAERHIIGTDFVDLYTLTSTTPSTDLGVRIEVGNAYLDDSAVPQDVYNLETSEWVLVNAANCWVRGANNANVVVVAGGV